MATYKAPLDDMRFILNDVFQADQLWASMSATADVTRDLSDAILDEAGKIAANVLHPLNKVGDEQGCTLENGVVRTPEGFKDAWAQMAEGGWMGLDASPDFGGQGMPYLMNTATGELFSSANMAFQMYVGLSHGAASALAGI